MKKNTSQPEGNYYDKYGSRNPIVKRIMRDFFIALDEMLEMSEIAKGGHCLEAGCGEGHITSHIFDWIQGHKANVYFSAYDISSKLIADNQRRYPEINFFLHNIYEPIKSEHLPNGGQFTLVVCSEVLEHLEKPGRAVRNLMRCSDRFLFSVPNEPIWRILNMTRGKYLRDFGNTPGHIQHFSKDSFCKMLEKCGLKVIKLKTPLPWLMVYCEKG